MLAVDVTADAGAARLRKFEHVTKSPPIGRGKRGKSAEADGNGDIGPAFVEAIGMLQFGDLASARDVLLTALASGGTLETQSDCVTCDLWAGGDSMSCILHALGKTVSNMTPAKIVRTTQKCPGCTSAGEPSTASQHVATKGIAAMAVMRKTYIVDGTAKDEHIFDAVTRNGTKLNADAFMKPADACGGLIAEAGAASDPEQTQPAGKQDENGTYADGGRLRCGNPYEGVCSRRTPTTHAHTRDSPSRQQHVTLTLTLTMLHVFDVVSECPRARRRAGGHKIQGEAPAMMLFDFTGAAQVKPTLRLSDVETETWTMGEGGPHVPVAVLHKPSAEHWAAYARINEKWQVQRRQVVGRVGGFTSVCDVRRAHVYLFVCLLV